MRGAKRTALPPLVLVDGLGFSGQVLVGSAGSFLQVANCCMAGLFKLESLWKTSENMILARLHECPASKPLPQRALAVGPSKAGS